MKRYSQRPSERQDVSSRSAPCTAPISTIRTMRSAGRLSIPLAVAGYQPIGSTRRLALKSRKEVSGEPSGKRIKRGPSRSTTTTPAAVISQSELRRVVRLALYQQLTQQPTGSTSSHRAGPASHRSPTRKSQPSPQAVSTSTRSRWKPALIPSRSARHRPAFARRREKAQIAESPLDVAPANRSAALRAERIPVSYHAPRNSVCW